MQLPYVRLVSPWFGAPLVALAAAGLAASLGGCSSEDDRPTASKKPVDPEDDPSFYSKNQGGSGGSAGASGASGAAGQAGAGGSGGPSCAPGKKACGADCVAKDDPATGCGSPSCEPCGKDHGKASCEAGACVVTCEAGFFDCDGDPKNGCESQLSDEANCGECGKVCAPAHAAGACKGGSCGLGACAQGWGDCDGDAKNGCEALLATAEHCGSCGVKCAAGESCGAGKCSAGCPQGKADCDGDASNGCEGSIATLASCGGCGVPCSPPHASGDCAQGVCKVATCEAGYADCDGDAANGCETRVGTVQNCGGCGVVCDQGNGHVVCSAGACLVSACKPGFGSCNGKGEDGCESPLDTVENCGQCGASCGPNQVCSGDACSCAPGFSTCSGACVDLQSDLKNCGGCGAACPPGELCASGKCGASCGKGEIVCAGACVDPKTDAQNCGECGASCPGKQICQAGACACPSPLVDCGGACVDLQTDAGHCGSCGSACEGSCQAGACVCATGTACGGKCVDTTIDAKNCGMCGLACGQGQICSDGGCKCLGAGQIICSGACIDVQSDVNNCGACGVSCGAQAFCFTGNCQTMCSGTLCGSLCVDLLGDAGNCGKCGLACASGASCIGGACQCPVDQQECGGACISVFDVANCGACGASCPTGQNADPACGDSGVCSLVCHGGYADCDTAPGCEADLTSDATCGSCSVSCGPTSNTHCDGSSCVSNFVKVAAGDAHTCAMRADGAVFCWGDGSLGQLGQGNAKGSDVPLLVSAPKATAIVAGRNHTCVLTLGSASTDDIYCWGDDAHLQAGAQPAGSTVAASPQLAVSLPKGMVKSLTAGGDVTCWIRGIAGIVPPGISCLGRGDLAQNGSPTFADSATPLSIGNTPPTLVELALGGDHGCLIGKDSSNLPVLRCWGSNERGQLGADLVVGPGAKSASALFVNGVSPTYTALSLGRAHSCVSNGSGKNIACWGDDTHGQFGAGVASTMIFKSAVAGTVSPASGLLPVAASPSDSTAFLAVGGAGYTAFLWGDNGSGQLGDGTTADVLKSTQQSVSGVKSVAIGKRHACLVRTSGRVECSGDASLGRLGAGPQSGVVTKFQLVKGI